MNPVLQALSTAPTSDGGGISQAISVSGALTPQATDAQVKLLMDVQAKFKAYCDSLAAAKASFGG